MRYLYTAEDDPRRLARMQRDMESSMARPGAVDAPTASPCVRMVTEVLSCPIDDRRAMEVHLDSLGEYWVGLAILSGPRDWTFLPREQYGTGEPGRRMAEHRARSWAAETIRDARWMALDTGEPMG